MASLRQTFIDAEKEGMHRIAYDYRGWGGDPQIIVSAQPFTINNINCTPALSHVGDRPVASYATNQGTGTATDGSNNQYGTASHQFVAGKLVRFRFGWRAADATNHEWALGVWVVNTNILLNIASVTDYFLINKLLSETVFSVEARKATGTAEATALSHAALANATNYDVEVYVSPSTTAGRGIVEVWMSKAGEAWFAVGAGDSNPYGQFSISTQLPDTVNTAFGFAFREGDTGTDATVVAYVQMTGLA